jgi:N,N'-diacetyllegionaminate synthase
MRDNFNVLVGFSDHSPELSLSIAATTMGACVIERHFTLDRNMSGPDHAISDNPEMLSQFIRGVRHIECCLEGLHTTQKVALYSQNEALPDKKMRIFSRRGAYARCNINAGEPIKVSALKFLRPQKDGVNPSTFYRYKKTVAKCPIKEGTLIKTKMLDIE